jgi:hypothetical protein
MPDSSDDPAVTAPSAVRDPDVDSSEIEAMIE